MSADVDGVFAEVHARIGEETRWHADQAQSSWLTLVLSLLNLAVAMLALGANLAPGPSPSWGKWVAIASLAVGGVLIGRSVLWLRRRRRHICFDPAAYLRMRLPEATP